MPSGQATPWLFYIGSSTFPMHRANYKNSTHTHLPQLQAYVTTSITQRLLPAQQVLDRAASVATADFQRNIDLCVAKPECHDLLRGA